jgi:hypothetical protein
MVERIRALADVSIRRGCGFGLIAIATAMVGVGHDIALAAYGGSIMVALMGAILVAKGISATRRSYKRTELWLLLDRDHGLPEARAQAVIGAILRERYYWHARRAAAVAGVLWSISLVLRVV